VLRNFRASETFWRNFYALSESQKASVRDAWEIFKRDPFDPRLRSHKIHALSAIAKRTIFSAVVEANLRVVFYIDGDTVYTVDIGSHSIYG
jgi:mRNA-degrading endonuclease YafQ of YafQ-DinJ toxin-antitoxin module